MTSSNCTMERGVSDCLASPIDQLPKNVSENERWVSMFGSGLLVAAGLSRGSPMILACGMGLAFRALTGYYPLYQAIEKSSNQPADNHLSHA